MAFMGGLIGLFGHAWYTALDKHFPGTTLKIITKKILLDQLIFSPLYMYPFFIGKLILIDNLYRQWLDINIEFQTQASKFEPWRSEAELVTSWSRMLPTIFNFYE